MFQLVASAVVSSSTNQPQTSSSPKGLTSEGFWDLRPTTGFLVRLLHYLVRLLEHLVTTFFVSFKNWLFWLPPTAIMVLRPVYKQQLSPLSLRVVLFSTQTTTFTTNYHHPNLIYGPQITAHSKGKVCTWTPNMQEEVAQTKRAIVLHTVGQQVHEFSRGYTVTAIHRMSWYMDMPYPTWGFMGLRNHLCYDWAYNPTYGLPNWPSAAYPHNN